MTSQPILKSSTGANRNHQTHDVSSYSPIPDSIERRLSLLSIPLNHRIRKAIDTYHISQVIGALNHVEANYELIKSPIAIFLHQLPKQSITKNKSLSPVYTAASFSGYTIAHMKAWYPNHWKDAALRFGISLQA